MSAKTFWKVVVPCLGGAVIVGGVCGLLAVDKIVMPAIVHIDRGTVTVPNITGLSWEDARQTLFNIGLRLRIGSRQYDEKIPREYIIGQQPPAMENVKKGRMVIATISKGSEIGVVPNVLGMMEHKAGVEIKKAGFIIGKIKRDYNSDYPKNTIAIVSPNAGMTISKEMPLDLVVSDGPKPTHVSVPNLIGESLLEAKGIIAKTGLKLGKIDNKQNATVPPGTVISQSLPPESSVPLESAITIVVSVSK